MNKEEILILIDELATELERKAYNEGENGRALKAERLSEQAKGIRELQKEIRNG